MNGEFLFKRALLEINVSSEPILDKSLMISVLYLLEILLTPNSTNFIFLNFLIKTLNIPKSRALPISNKFSRIKSLEKRETVRQFLHNVGFSDTHIQLTVTSRPTILFSDVDKTLKPKIEFFQHLGLVGSDLGKFISKNPSLLAASLERKLIPCVEILKKILVDDSNNEDLTRVFRRCCWNLIMDTEKSGLLRNIEYLKSCGIVGSQLSMLLVGHPRLFCFKELKIRHLVSRLLDMGFSTNSRMFVYGLVVLSCLNEETFGRKLELFRSYGFSKEEVLQMFRKAPLILKASEERLQLGLEFFLKVIECEKSVLVRTPICLACSIENRVIPRYRVFQIIMSRGMFKEDFSFSSTLLLSEGNFLQKFVLSFGDDAEELLLSYNGHKLGS
ncbi:hypothetical protein WN944_023545 [Citrus x changshan-huyou]|uniref:Uncharacterized protein n=1 Tax=Citrus x changshan-huyou TaxID=2935761 RepID=A0AAP0N2H7_9ROSI